MLLNNDQMDLELGFMMMIIEELGREDEKVNIDH